MTSWSDDYASESMQRGDHRRHDEVVTSTTSASIMIFANWCWPKAALIQVHDPVFDDIGAAISDATVSANQSQPIDCLLRREVAQIVVFLRRPCGYRPPVASRSDHHRHTSDAYVATREFTSSARPQLAHYQLSYSTSVVNTNIIPMINNYITTTP